ncbi:hypothetical protein [Virgibacillus ihumii]|uniref:hypothetical protein n=1 Tax=Virgibacillus ihumii TaxID=2686091 RepID=UPI00157CBA06|nr:hypothetical protein [Virgibacillus ihumii]
MKQKDQFFRLLTEVKRKLWLQAAVQILYTALLTCAGLLLLWIAASRFFVILYLDTKIVVTIGLVIAGFLIYFLLIKPGSLEAAKKFDQQGLDDRVMTSFHFMDETSTMAELQRKDTLKKMKHVLPAIKQEKAGWFQWRKLAVFASLLLLAYLGVLFPSDFMEIAKDKEEEQEIVNENQEKVEQFTEKHQEQVGEKADEQLDKLLEEVKKEKKAEEMKEDLLQAEKQLNELKQQSQQSQKQLDRAAKELQKQGLNNLANAINQKNPSQMEKQMAMLKERLDNLSEKELQSLKEKLQSAAKSMGMDNEALAEGKLSKEQLDQLMSKMEKQLKNLAESAGNASKLATAQKELQQLARNMNQQLASAGLGTPGSLTFSSGASSSSNSSGTSGQSGESGQQGQSGAGSGNSSGSGSDSGSGSGAGSGSGSGSGTGSGSGSGTGAGSGSGSGSGGNGAGLGKGNRNLTVPKKLDGRQNREVDTGKSGSGPTEQQVAPNAPVLPGEVRSYDEVYQHYKNTYREALERNDYPDHLQKIIKGYFSDIEPEKGAN